MSTLLASPEGPDSGSRRIAKRRRLGYTILGALAALVLAAVFLVPLVLPPRQKVASSWPSATWETAAPEEQGLDSAKLADALDEMQSRNLRIHSLTLIRNGYLVLDATFYPYDATQPHNMASVTKTITATLIGIAADQDKLRLDQPVLSFFPERTVANRSQRADDRAGPGYDVVRPGVPRAA
jgi:CubicO group peptidase (beta-lactamase class C family)